MRTPVEIIKGRVVAYDPATEVVTIQARYGDWKMMEKRGYRECLVQMLDGRPISNKQRNVCYMLLRAIADSTGQNIETVKETLKEKFLLEDAQAWYIESFSLRDVPMSLACAFQRYLVRFLLEFDIPTDFRLLDYVDDVSDFLYSCLVQKKCCICGKASDLHHVDRVGLARDREEIIHEGMEVLPLCRIHHGEAHQIGQLTFNQKYHIEKGIVLDKNLCHLYGLKTYEDDLQEAMNNEL